MDFSDEPSGEELRDQQEEDLARDHALAVMEYALARETFDTTLLLRDAGVDVDPLTFIVLRILGAAMEVQGDPMELVEVLQDSGSLERSVEIATDLLDAA